MSAALDVASASGLVDDMSQFTEAMLDELDRLDSAADTSHMSTSRTSGHFTGGHLGRGNGANAGDTGEDEGSGDDGLLDDVLDGEDDGFLSDYRERRMAELQRLAETAKNLQQQRDRGELGQYVEIADEKAFLQLTTDQSASSGRSGNLCCVQFYKEGFERCRIMDVHLRALAQRYVGVRFAKLSVDKAPFFVQKLALKVLPTVVSFRNGRVIDRMVGFTALSGAEMADDFRTEVLERRLMEVGLLRQRTTRGKNGPAASSTSSSSDSEDDDFTHRGRSLR